MSDTRRHAYVASRHWQSEGERRVLAFFLDRGDATDDEGWGAEGLNMPQTSWIPLRYALVQKGLLRDSGRRRNTRRGFPATVWEPTVRTLESPAAAVKWETLRCGACGYEDTEPKFTHTVFFGISCPRCGSKVAKP